MGSCICHFKDVSKGEGLREGEREGKMIDGKYERQKAESQGIWEHNRLGMIDNLRKRKLQVVCVLWRKEGEGLQLPLNFTHGSTHAITPTFPIG